MQSILLAIFAGLLTLLLCVAMLRLAMRERMRLQRRMDQLGIGGMPIAVQATQEHKVRKGRIPVSRVFAEELISAGIRMRPEEFLIVWLIIVLVFSGVPILANAHMITSLVLGLVGLLIPPVMVYRSRAKRLVLFEQQLGDALMLMGNALRAGMTFQQAMISIANEMPDPISREFARTVREIQLGGNVDTALSNMVQRVRSTDLMITVSAIQIQRQVGGNILEILENISVTIKERIKLKDDIRVLTATGRASGMVVGLMPLGILGMLSLINPAYVMLFFNTQMGIAMLIAAAVMEVVGFLVIRRIVTIKY